MFVNAKQVSIKMPLFVTLVLINADPAPLQLSAQLALTMPQELLPPIVPVMLDSMMLEQLCAQLAHLFVSLAHQPLPAHLAMPLITELLPMDSVSAQLDSSKLPTSTEPSPVLPALPVATLVP